MTIKLQVATVAKLDQHEDRTWPVEAWGVATVLWRWGKEALVEKCKMGDGARWEWCGCVGRDVNRVRHQFGEAWRWLPMG